MRMHPASRAAVLAFGLSACTLLTKLDGLSGGDTAATLAGSDASSPSDAPSSDGAAEGAPGTADGGSGNDAGDDGSSQCGHTGPTQGLLAYYAFEEGSGSTVHDCSGNRLDGAILHLASDTWTTGKKGGGLRVQSPDGCVDLGIPPSLQAPTMSISAWVNVHTYPASTASGYVVGQTLNADSSGWRFGTISTDGGALGWQHAASSMKYPVVAAGPATNTWHHVAVTFAPSAALVIYVDGKIAATQSALPAISFSAVSYRIGCRADDANVFDGLIDELRIYDRVLTATEITTLAAP